MMNMTFDASTLLSASETLKSHDEWVIFTHRKSDGDAMGSACALFEAGVNLGKRVRWCSPDAKLPEGYSYLPHFADFQTHETFTFANDGTLYVFLDCATELRSVSGYVVGAGINSLNIDHHEDNSLYARVNCVDGHASSTCELLFRLFTAGGWNITKTIAECLYTGLFTDSGSFSFSNTSPLTHAVAGELISLGAEPGHMTDLITQNKTVNGLHLWGVAMSRVRTFGEDGVFALSYLEQKDFADTRSDNTETEGLPAFLMSLMGVKFAVMFTEYPERIVRASFRSREGSPFGAGEIARLVGGGGHERASGATLEGTLKECMTRIEELLLTKYHECSSAHQ